MFGAVKTIVVVQDQFRLHIIILLYIDHFFQWHICIQLVERRNDLECAISSGDDYLCIVPTRPS